MLCMTLSVGRNFHVTFAPTVTRHISGHDVSVMIMGSYVTITVVDFTIVVPSGYPIYLQTPYHCKPHLADHLTFSGPFKHIG